MRPERIQEPDPEKSKTQNSQTTLQGKIDDLLRHAEAQQAKESDDARSEHLAVVCTDVSKLKAYIAYNLL